MALEVKLFARDLKLTDRMREYVDKKVGKLDRYINNISEARVDLAYVKSARDANDRYVAQITIHGKGFVMRAEERSDDIFTALDTAVPKIQRRIKRYKGKHYQHRGNGVSAAEVAGIMPVEEEADEGPEIVRRKHFILTPMDEMEAIEQMELLGHEDFFLFLNANSGQINVLYKRRDGKYGVIEPEIA
ncbi:MAG: ribosome-associated translation inhibitor RaiA [Anaerolineales bacterium]|nr:ribosome-associated translation inhibitor RaiA [Anaerolineales bacterium]